jgi:hypothetical protein
MMPLPMLIMESPRWPFTVVQQAGCEEVSCDIYGSPSYDCQEWLPTLSPFGWPLVLASTPNAADALALLRQFSAIKPPEER